MVSYHQFYPPKAVMGPEVATQPKAIILVADHIPRDWISLDASHSPHIGICTVSITGILPQKLLLTSFYSDAIARTAEAALLMMEPPIDRPWILAGDFNRHHHSWRRDAIEI